MSSSAASRSDIASTAQGVRLIGRAPGLRVGVLTRVVAAFAALHLPRRAVELELHLVSAKTIRTWNKELRGIDRPTDVLSLERFIPPVGPVLLGPIFLCMTQIRRGATDATRDPRYLLAHGLLHCIGWDHATARDAARMDRAVHRVLAYEHDAH